MHVPATVWFNPNPPKIKNVSRMALLIPMTLIKLTWKDK